MLCAAPFLLAEIETGRNSFGQLAGIDAITLATVSHGILSRITHQDFRHVRLHQVVQPGRPGSFFEDHAHISTQTIEKLQKGTRLGLPISLPKPPNYCFLHGPRLVTRLLVLRSFGLPRPKLIQL